MARQVEIVENALWTKDPGQARAVEQIVEKVCRDEGVDAVRVRFSVFRDSSPGLRFLCKVDCAADHRAGSPAWRWWSSVNRRPQELRHELTRGLRAHRRSVRHAMPVRAAADRIAFERPRAGETGRGVLRGSI
jgi:hypothetical protein